MKRTVTFTCGATTTTTDEPCKNPVKKKGDLCSRQHGSGKKDSKQAEQSIKEKELMAKVLSKMLSIKSENV
jgi:hypothetical protein